MKKLIALLLAIVMVAGVIGCTSSTPAPAEKPAVDSSTDKAPVTAETTAEPEKSESVDLDSLAPGSVTITLMLPLGQWTDNFDILIESYKKQAPWIKDIEASFPSSDTAKDLMVSALAANNLPDIVSIYYGTSQKDWFQYLVDLSTDCPAYELLTPDQIALGTCEYGMVIMPIYVEGTGIMYNMRLLGEVGWDHTPTTPSELKKLCEDLTAAGIKPFMHQWSETYLNLLNWVGPTWMAAKENQGLDMITKMVNGEDVGLANDPDWNAFLDVYETILIPYAQEGAIATDKWTCRNAFFNEECAMLVGEGSWETPNIANTNPALLEYVCQSYLPIYEEADKNMLQLQTITCNVTNSGDPIRIAAAKDFVSYMVSSEDARLWHQELMGSPTSIASLGVSENLPKLGKDVVNLIQAGKAAESMFEWTPEVIDDDLAEAWARYVAGQDDRATFTARYEKIFKDYSEGFYG